MATAADRRTAPKRFFLMYIPHGTAPEHFNAEGDNATVDPTAQANYTDFASTRPTSASWARCSRTSRTSTSTRAFQYPGAADTHTGIVNCLSGITDADTTTRAHHASSTSSRKALNVKPLILGACSHITNGLDANGMLFWNGTPVDPQKSPVKAFDALFGGQHRHAAPVNADVQLRKDLLAFTGVRDAGPADDAARA